MKRPYIILIILIFCFGNILNAQISHGGEPLSFKQSVSKSATVFNTPSFDYQQLLLEDNADSRTKPYRYGKLHEVNLSPDSSGTWNTNSNGLRIWQIKIHSEKAYSLGLIFNKFKLNEGVNMYVFSKDRKRIIGSFTHENNNKSGWFSTIGVEGDEIIVELDVPSNIEYGEINISGIVHDYRNAQGLKTGYGSSGSCNVNINCPDGADWQLEKRAVVKFSYVSGGVNYCTGVLINNTAFNSKPYILTANHCIGSQSVANSAIFMFNYESAGCVPTGNFTPPSISGATLIATGGNLDFSLLELSSVPPTLYNVYYAGWDKGTSSAQNTVTIHHPEGDLKKISKDYDAPVISNYDNYYIQNSHWNILNWDLGTTEPGSSGSPLFDQNHHIVGGLTGGAADCYNSIDDYYARFDMSWDYYSDPTRQLKAWLDPLNVNTKSLNGFDPNLITSGVDIGVLQVNVPTDTYCANSEIIPEIVIQNRGNVDLTNAVVSYKLNNGIVVSQNWTGNLKTFETASFKFNSILAPVGNIVFKAYTTAPNGLKDNNNYNDTVISPFFGEGPIDSIPINGPKEICSQSLDGIYSVYIPGKYLWKANGGIIDGSDTTQSISVVWNDWGDRFLNLNITNLCNSTDAESFKIDVVEQTLDLQIATGDNGANVCWSITDCDGNIMEEECGLESNINYSTKICLYKGCYRFNLYSDNLGITSYSLHNVLNSQEIAKGLSVDGSFKVEFILNPSNNLADFNVYPNPAESELVIEGIYNELYKNAKFAIYKLDGAMVIPFNNLDERQTIDISTLPKGMYIIEINSENGKFSKKFVKP